MTEPWTARKRDDGRHHVHRLDSRDVLHEERRGRQRQILSTGTLPPTAPTPSEIS